MMDRISGSLINRWAMDVPADPGWSQPDRHRSDSAGGTVDRDDASSGGGWQPTAWSAGQVTVLTGSDATPRPGHRTRPGHDGDQGRGRGRRDTDLRSCDEQLGGRHSPADLRSAGASGAAHGGLVATGVSAPWANAAVSRRRADGKTVDNPGGLRLGSRYDLRIDRHRQGLHVNRPFLRFIRLGKPVVERDSPSPGGRTSPFNPITRLRTAGPVNPRMRRLVKPAGQREYDPIDEDPGATPELDPGPIGGDWAL